MKKTERAFGGDLSGDVVSLDLGPSNCSRSNWYGTSKKYMSFNVFDRVMSCCFFPRVPYRVPMCPHAYK